MSDKPSSETPKVPEGESPDAPTLTHAEGAEIEEAEGVEDLIGDEAIKDLQDGGAEDVATSFEEADEDTADAAEPEADDRDDASAKAEDTVDAPFDAASDETNLDETGSDQDGAADTPDEVSDPVSEKPEVESSNSEKAASHTPPHAASSSSNLMPALLGGGISAIVGGALVYILIGQTPAPAPDVSPRLQAIEAALSNLADAPAPTAAPDMTQQIEALAASVAALQEQIANAPAPSASGGPVSVDTSALSGELVALREAIEAQAADNAALQERMQAIAAEAEAQVEAARAEAGDVRTRAVRTAALAEIDAALASGAEMVGPLAVLADQGVDVPEGLTQHAAGIATLAEVQASFPSAARIALDASRKAVMGSGAGDRLTTFLSTQLGARSLEPRAGDDPDAILSRAESLVRAGDLGAALAEVEALPEQGRTALAEWSTQARARLDAETALLALAAMMNEG